MTGEPPVFAYTEKLDIPGRGAVYAGPCPIAGNIVGRKVIVDGKVRVVRICERSGWGEPLKIGDPVGLIFVQHKSG